MKSVKPFIVTIASIAILAGAWFYAFGIPQPVARIFQQQAQGSTDSSSPQNAQNAGAAGGAASGAASGAPGGSAGSQAGGPRGGNRATTVKTARLGEQPYTLVLRTIGSVRSRYDVSVTSSQDGEIGESALEANKIVNRGDLLLKLDDVSERLSLEVAEATRDKTLDTVSRYRTLRQSGNLSVTQQELADAELDLRLAQANVALAQRVLDERSFKAPIGGRLGLSDLEVGDRVSSGDFIVTIDDASTILAEFEVPERSMSLLEIGREVLISTPTYRGRNFKGKVTAFDSRLDSVTRSATVQAEIDNSDALLLSGMTLAVRMIDETDPFPVVPATAITWNRDGAGIWVVDDKTTSRHSIVIKYRDGDSVWVDTDVSLDSTVVVEGASKLRDGATVNAIATDTGADT